MVVVHRRTRQFSTPKISNEINFVYFCSQTNIWNYFLHMNAFSGQISRSWTCPAVRNGWLPSVRWTWMFLTDVGSDSRRYTVTKNTNQHEINLMIWKFKYYRATHQHRRSQIEFMEKLRDENVNLQHIGNIFFLYIAQHINEPFEVFVRWANP